MSSRTHRDRHGRGLRSPLFTAQVPAARTREERFSRAASRIMEKVRFRAGGELDSIVLAVDAVPTRATGSELGRVFPGDAAHPPTLVLYRLPIISRAEDPEDLVTLLTEVITEQAGLVCGRDPEDLWP